MYLFSFTSSIEPGVVFVPPPRFKLSFVEFPIITILSIVPLRSVISVLSLLSVRTFPLSRPVLPFFALAAEHVRARESTIASLINLEGLGIGFSFPRVWPQLGTAERILLHCGEGKSAEGPGFVEVGKGSTGHCQGLRCCTRYTHPLRVRRRGELSVNTTAWTARGGHPGRPRLQRLCASDRRTGKVRRSSCL